jgi:hypothetical protein
VRVQRAEGPVTGRRVGRVRDPGGAFAWPRRAGGEVVEVDARVGAAGGEDALLVGPRRGGGAEGEGADGGGVGVEEEGVGEGCWRLRSLGDVSLQEVLGDPRVYAVQNALVRTSDQPDMDIVAIVGGIQTLGFSDRN